MSSASANVNETKLKKKLIAFGDENQYRILFESFKKEFSTNKIYLNSTNHLEFVSKCNKSEYELRITTKYYDLNVDMDIFTLNSDNFEIDVEKTKTKINSNEFDFEGFIVLINNQENDNVYLSNNFISLLENLIDNNQSCFKCLISNLNENKNKIEHFIESFEDIIEIKLNLNDFFSEEKNQNEDFNDLNELINSFFVHNWTDMILKSDIKNKSLHIKEINDQNLNNNSVKDKEIDKNGKESIKDDEDDSDSFNFENILMNLSDMKEKASQMSFEERKKYAEEVVLKFWKAIDGDETEIADI